MQINSESTTILGIGATFTGAAKDMTSTSYTGAFQDFRAMAIADVASAANGFRIEVSNDNVTWRTAAKATTVANEPTILNIPVIAEYYRVVYVNGAAAQTFFMLNSSF